MTSDFSAGATTIPAHLAIIMDGNGRWAKARGLDRSDGHRAGASNVIKLAQACQTRGISVLSLFAFSTENWKRPKSEIDALFSIAADYFSNSFSKFPGMGIRLKVIGERKNLPRALKLMIEKAERANPKEYSLTLNMAVNYGGKWDIAKAAASLAERCCAGDMKPSDINEASMDTQISTSGQPPVDLLIRTGGERRISNFLIWQSAYSELYFSDKYWPDFDESELDLALAEFARRSRRFGGLA